MARTHLPTHTGTRPARYVVTECVHTCSSTRPLVVGSLGTNLNARPEQGLGELAGICVIWMCVSLLPFLKHFVF